MESLERGEKSKQRPRWHGFDDQRVSVFAHDGVIAGKLKLTWNSNCLVSAILEKLDVSFRSQNSHRR